MSSYIQKCAVELVKRHPIEPNFTIIIPSKRAKKYFMESLAKAYAKPIFLPQILTIEEFNASFSNLPIIDKTRQLFLLYNIARSLPKFQSLTFDEFLTWGPMVVDDFEDINRYLLDANQVFKNLISIKELESWNVDGERELSESQKKFMAFWDELPALYEQFNEALSTRSKTTSAHSLRRLAEETQDLIPAGSHYYFIGFNALSLGELTVIRALLKRNQATFWIDADEYYLSNSLHEAGYFLRKNLDFLSINSPEFILKTLANKAVKIDAIACAQSTGQVKLAATELANRSYEALQNTLVLLADESLIVPLMQNIPASVKEANITVGLPLKQTSIKSLLDVLFSIQENKIRFKSEAAYYKDLMQFFQHPLVAGWIDLETQGKISDWEHFTVQRNKVFQKIEGLSFSPALDSITRLAFTSWQGDYKFGLSLFFEISEQLSAVMSKGFELELQQILLFQEALVTMTLLADEGLPTMNLRTFKLFFNQHWSKKSIAFHGNPTQGLQIMGLLESRMLDFKHLIVLGMNEGFLPANNPIDSIIPMDLRRGLGLPTAREKQGLFAHHFYRLLHNADDVVITYGLSTEGLGASEPSRYIAQLEMEWARVNKNCTFKTKFYNTAFPNNTDFDSAIVVKRPQINVLLENYFTKNISASAISKYLNCPLDFYYRYLAEFGEEEDVEEELASNSMGKFIHDTLEQLYSPFAEYDSQGNKVDPQPPPLSVSAIEGMMTLAPEILKNEFLRYLDDDQKLIDSGKNWLTYNVAKELVNNLLSNEIEYIKSTNEEIYIHKVEARLTAPMTIQLQGMFKTIQWVGYVDRIDRIGAAFRLVDYKSGKVTDDHVIYKKKSDLITSFKGCKHALQLATYAYLFKENYNILPSNMGIYAIQRKTDAFYSLDTQSLSMVEFMEDFQQLMQEIITQIFDQSKPFEHNIDSKYCAYC